MEPVSAHRRNGPQDALNVPEPVTGKVVRAKQKISAEKAIAPSRPYRCPIATLLRPYCDPARPYRDPARPYRDPARPPAWFHRIREMSWRFVREGGSWVASPSVTRRRTERAAGTAAKRPRDCRRLDLEWGQLPH